MIIVLQYSDNFSVMCYTTLFVAKAAGAWSDALGKVAAIISIKSAPGTCLKHEVVQKRNIQFGTFFVKIPNSKRFLNKTVVFEKNFRANLTTCCVLSTLAAYSRVLNLL